MLTGDKAVRRAGLGRHFYDISPAESIPLLQFTYVLPMMYSLGVVTIKTSILLFYRRLFGCHVVLQRIARYFLLFQVAFAVASLITLALICIPARAWWSLGMRAQKCPTMRHVTTLYIWLRSVTVLCDVGVLLLPMHMVWQLHLPLRQRAGLLGVFMLGFLCVTYRARNLVRWMADEICNSACLVALVRLFLLPRLSLTIDVSCTCSSPPLLPPGC